MPSTPGMPEDTSHRLDGAAAGMLLLIALSVVIDVALDRPSTLWSAHVAIELLVVALCLSLAALLWRRWQVASIELGRTRLALASREAERDVWAATAAELMQGLRRAIDQQFTSWQLTPAEREVALLMLEGYGHRQIAGQTGRSERTVRQHAVSVYDKSGLDGRAALAGFFLSGLSKPRAIDRA